MATNEIIRALCISYTTFFIINLLMKFIVSLINYFKEKE